MSRWCRPDQSAWWVVRVAARGEREAGLVLHAMVARAEAFSAAFAGRSSGPRCAVIDVAELGGDVASGHPAGAVSGLEELAEGVRGTVIRRERAGPEAEQSAVAGVRDSAAPRAGGGALLRHVRDDRPVDLQMC